MNIPEYFFPKHVQIEINTKKIFRLLKGKFLFQHKQGAHDVETKEISKRKKG